MLGIPIIFVALLATSFADLRGVPLSKVDNYMDDGLICDTNKVLTSDRINDGFCDCKDALDEPGTAACPNGQFYCRNKGFQGRYIPSSRVEDSVCDCCDGSDEPPEQECPNVCEALADEYLRDRREEIDRIEQGSRLKQEYIAEGRAHAEERAKRLVQVEQKLVEAEKDLQVLEQLVKSEEAVEAEKKVQFEQEKSTTLLRQLKLDAFDSVALMELLVEVASRVENGSAILVDAVRDRLGSEVEVEWPEDSGETFSYAPAEEARSSLSSTQSTKITLANEKDEITKESETNFGPESEYYALKGKCFDKKVAQYTYKICPFNKVSQDHTSLGTWEGWGDDALTKQRYTNGQSCWNASNREATVILVCGMENKITTVDEPSTCVYEFTFETPAACESTRIESLSLDLTEEFEVDPAH